MILKFIKYMHKNIKNALLFDEDAYLIVLFLSVPTSN